MRAVLLQTVILALGAALVGVVFNEVRAGGIAMGKSVVDVKAEALAREVSAGKTSTEPGDAAKGKLDFRLTMEQTSELLRSGKAYFLDARPRVYYENGHIPGARNLPVARFDELIYDIAPELPADRPIVVYCDGGDCSASVQVAERLIQEMGYPNVHVYEGGFPEWASAGQPVSDGPLP